MVGIRGPASLGPRKMVSFDSRHRLRHRRSTWTKNALCVEVTHFDLAIRPAAPDNSRIVHPEVLLRPGPRFPVCRLLPPVQNLGKTWVKNPPFLPRFSPFLNTKPSEIIGTSAWSFRLWLRMSWVQIPSPT